MTRDYSTLPEPVRLEDTVAEQPSHELADAVAIRNPEQHAALRDE
ncbi:MAG: hypothetical protein WBP61_17605 [Nocardioides sp.]